MTDEQQIRALIERWAEAVHAGDLDVVLDDHAPDLVMFDVPPPYDGVRGLDAYRETWPGFFAWQETGAVFEIVSLEVTAGTDVAFAFALLKCGLPADVGDTRLRLTLGLRKEAGRWIVSHEHHSFPSVETPPALAESEVRAVHAHWSDRTAAKDLDGLMENIADDVVSYEDAIPLQYKGKPAVREVCVAGLDAAGGKVSFTTPDLTVVARDDVAISWGLDHLATETSEGPVETWSRATRVFKRERDGWQLIHQHLSYPVDPSTGAARTDLKP